MITYYYETEKSNEPKVIEAESDELAIKIGMLRKAIVIYTDTGNDQLHIVWEKLK